MANDPRSSDKSTTKKKKVLLIGWDGADWEHITPLLDQGLLPGLEALINRGVMGDLATLHPVLSPMLWNTIATGKTPDKHGILGFTKPASGGKGIEPFSSTNRKVKALWNILHQNNLRSNVVSWWASHPAEPIQGCMVSNLFNGIKRDPQGQLLMAPNLVSPPDKSGELAELKIHVDEITEHDLLPFIPLARRIDQARDSRLFVACKLLADCASVQSVTTHLMETEPWNLTAVYFDSIDHFCHAFMYYHPPKMSNVSADDFEIFKDVIKGAYQFHDMILQRLVHLAGEDTTVVLCSDHGFQSGHLRPLATPAEPAGPAAWHRDFGILVMAGPGIKQDQRIYGANIIDITPTILYQLGLPVGEDMDGRVLLEAFEQATPPARIPSWETQPGACGMHNPDSLAGRAEERSGSPAANDDLIEQFVALGYINDPGEDLEKNARNCQLELDYNLARVYLSTNRYPQALEIFERLVHQMPWEDRYWKNLAETYFELGYFLQAHQIVADLYRDISNKPVSSLIFLAKTSARMGEIQQCESYLQEIMQQAPKQPMFNVSLGNTYLVIKQPEQAKLAFERALENDPDCPYGYLGLAEYYFRKKDFAESAEQALSALALLFRIERAHWILGVSLMQLRQFERAEQAFRNLLKFENSGYHTAACRYLAFLARERDCPEEEEHLRELAAAGRSNRMGKKKMEFSRMRQLFDLPQVPTTQHRRTTFIAERPKPQRGGRQKESPPEDSGRILTVVSGLPRSGTSLMMQMLQAGGLAPQTDGFRSADIDNPEGYLEWEAIKSLSRNPGILDDRELDNKAIKIISMLLPFLPANNGYKVIFMRRPSSQIARSQQKMLERLGKESASPDQNRMVEQLEAHSGAIQSWLQRQSFIDCLMLDYPDLILDPEANARKVAEFLQSIHSLDWKKMVQVVNPELFRNV
jgi:tetratricopeptide (TPR) repeat protein